MTNKGCQLQSTKVSCSEVVALRSSMDIVVQKSYVEQIKVGIMQIMNNILLVLPVLNLELSVARLSMCV